MSLPLLDAAAFTSERALHWMVAPFLPEHFDDFVLPVVIAGVRPMIVSLRGMVLPATYTQGRDLQLAGHTSSFNSKFTIVRTDKTCKMSGIYNGEHVDYTVILDTTMVVSGRTGKAHAKYSADHSREDIHVHGNTSGLHSDYRISLKPAGAMIEGIDAGENVSVELTADDTGWHWKGEAAKGFLALSAIAQDQDVVLAGTQNDHPAKVTLETTDSGFRVHGFDTWGNVDFTVTFTGNDDYKVHGRADHNILDYAVTFTGTPMPEVPKTIAVPAGRNPFDPPTERVTEQQMLANQDESS